VQGNVKNNLWKNSQNESTACEYIYRCISVYKIVRAHTPIIYSLAIHYLKDEIFKKPYSAFFLSLSSNRSRY